MIEEFVGIRAKTQLYLNLKLKKKQLKFEGYKHCLEATQLENKIILQGKNRVNVDSLKVNHKEFIKKHKLTLKFQQRFKSKKDNVFTEELKNIALSANKDKRIEPTDLAEIYAYETSNDLIRKKEETKCKIL